MVSKSKGKESVRLPSREMMVVLGIVFLVGLFIGVNAAVPGVSHMIDELRWDLIVDPTSPGSAEMVVGVNNASGSAPFHWGGIDADTIDGLDSTELGGGGSGGAALIYEVKCPWKFEGGYTDAVPSPPSWPGVPGDAYYQTVCMDQEGNPVPAPANVPRCEAGDTQIGTVQYIPTGVTWSGAETATNTQIGAWGTVGYSKVNCLRVIP